MTEAPRYWGFSEKNMNCPYCGNDDLKVLDSRPARDGEAIRRRRECGNCRRRFTTFEGFEKPRLFVVKRDGAREEFERDKVMNSMVIACRKRRVPIEDLHNAIDRIERDLYQEYEDEVPSAVIGEAVMNELQGIDTVAYVRFASVYREFQTINDFREIINAMRAKTPTHQGKG